MSRMIVRLSSIVICNFKNVKHGFLFFDDSNPGAQASILGLYGQNGSGKTALIDSLEMLSFILTRRSVPSFFADYINVDSEFASICYGFKIYDLDDRSVYYVYYNVSLRRDVKNSESNTLTPSQDREEYGVTLFNEILSYDCYSGGQKTRLTTIINTSTNSNIAFTPKVKYLELVGKSKQVATDLLVARLYAQKTSSSFIFSKALMDAMRGNNENGIHRQLIKRLADFGNFEFSVINTRGTGLIALNMLPLSFNYKEESGIAYGSMPIMLDEPFAIPERALDILQHVIKSMNIVLNQLVPGLTVNLHNLGSQLAKDGTKEYIIELVSLKNGKEIPFRYESEGIKKLFSVLHLLIKVYNNPSMTVAIDELDSGIFEYLLGEILHIIADGGKGQLIFTSHNLRPLEILDKNSIAFTTTNPENRYIRMNNVKASNNLRDLYYRDIILGGQRETIYEPTNDSEIALAFREACNDEPQ